MEVYKLHPICSKHDVCIKESAHNDESVINAPKLDLSIRNDRIEGAQ